ncbi:hypothetical protein [Streptomyces sp. NBC_00878]|uniref:hypothetical protein n=1 Tax=Streptomyces sp. NBC_00878 TaxID=2975854 RepID=UPI00225404E3|nr:hypothetical protein [Streptomyces sp. NBC_00878]MCX4910802.1 hypothetical protein [Streptomyces sp. NBC_00878]
MLFLVVAVIVVVGAVSAVALVTTSGDGSSDKKSPSESNSTSGLPSPSLSIPSELPSELPSLPTDVPSDLPSSLPTDLESLLPSLASDEVPYYMLRTGDCFNIDDTKPGQAAKRSCSAAHDAEVVTVAELEGTYTTDAALKKAASALCAKPLDTKAAKQPAGTVRGTVVQYPDPTGFKLGIDNVACSLAADVGVGNRKLTKPLK